MMTPAMLRRLLLALVAFSLVRVFAVEGFAMDGFTADAKGATMDISTSFGLRRGVGVHARGRTRAT